MGTNANDWLYTSYAYGGDDVALTHVFTDAPIYFVSTTLPDNGILHLATVEGRMFKATAYCPPKGQTQFVQVYATFANGETESVKWRIRITETNSDRYANFLTTQSGEPIVNSRGNPINVEAL